MNACSFVVNDSVQDELETTSTLNNVQQTQSLEEAI